MQKEPDWRQIGRGSSGKIVIARKLAEINHLRAAKSRGGNVPSGAALRQRANCIGEQAAVKDGVHGGDGVKQQAAALAGEGEGAGANLAVVVAAVGGDDLESVAGDDEAVRVSALHL